MFRTYGQYGSSLLDALFKPKETHFRRWAPDLPHHDASEPWPEWCIPFGVDDWEPNASEELPKEHHGNFLRWSSKPAELVLSIWVDRPPAAREDVPAKFKVFLRSSSGRWTCLGIKECVDAEEWIGTEKWDGGEGALLVVPVDHGAWGQKPGFYDVHLTCSGVQTGTPFALPKGESVDPKKIDEAFTPSSKVASSKGPNRKA